MRLCDLEVDLDKWYRLKADVDEFRIVAKTDVRIACEDRNSREISLSPWDDKSEVTLVEPEEDEPECLYEHASVDLDGDWVISNYLKPSAILKKQFDKQPYKVLRKFIEKDGILEEVL